MMAVCGAGRRACPFGRLRASSEQAKCAEGRACHKFRRYDGQINSLHVGAKKWELPSPYRFVACLSRSRASRMATAQADEAHETYVLGIPGLENDVAEGQDSV